MIPILEDIIRGLLDGTMSPEQARAYLDEHERMAAEATEQPADGVDRIAFERDRQRVVEGYDAEHDATYRDKPGSLAMAGIVYATCAACGPEVREVLRGYADIGKAPLHWPWPAQFWKPGKDDSTESRVRELEKAGALIAAEIDFLLAVRP